MNCRIRRNRPPEIHFFKVFHDIRPIPAREHTCQIHSKNYINWWTYRIGTVFYQQLTRRRHRSELVLHEVGVCAHLSSQFSIQTSESSLGVNYIQLLFLSIAKYDICGSLLAFAPIGIRRIQPFHPTINHCARLLLEQCVRTNAIQTTSAGSNTNF
jgi:hypothetical protein